MTTIRLKGVALGLVFALAAAGCDILDVENPNELTADDAERVTAANAVVNGALATVMRGIDAMALPYQDVTDELIWIGSRDAWLTLDQGNISDPNNEFVDQMFPPLAQGRWMADFAIDNLETHVAEDPGNPALELDRARAYFIAGMVYSAIGQMMEDFAFSDRTEAGPAIGPENFDTALFGQAITYFDEALSEFERLGASELALRALAWRAQTKHARSIRALINPTYNPGDGLVDAGAADAADFVGRVGTTSDWKYDFVFTSGTIGSTRGAWINQRGELIFGPTFVDVDPANPTVVTAIDYMDPIDNIPDPRVVRAVDDFLIGGTYPYLTVASAREMHLILAESALDQGDTPGAITHINHVRAMDGLTAYSDGLNGVAVKDMLIHERTANLFGQNRRLADLYRFGIGSPEWQSNSEVVNQPGMLLPITCIEIRANELLSSDRC